MQSSNNCENMEDIIINFIEKLNKKLDADNKHQQKLCSEDHHEINSLRCRKNSLYNIVWHKLFSAENCQPAPFLVGFLFSSSKLTNGSLENMLKQIDDGVVQHNAASIEWRHEIEKNLQLKNDNFTMMPYDNINTEIERIQNKIKSIESETIKGKEAINLDITNMESEDKIIWEDIANIQIYEKEIRKENLQLKEELENVKRKRDLDIPNSNFNDQQISELQKEIEELQKK